jgi:hypothetical protein
MMKLRGDTIATTALPLNIEPYSFKTKPVNHTEKTSASSKSRIWSVVAIMLLLILLGTWSNDYLHSQLWSINFEQAQMLIGCLLLVYAVCMMLPFMPAIELGLLLLAMLDIQGVVWLYLVTVLALTISYGIGRLIPVSMLKKLFEYLNFHRAVDLLCCAGECGEKEQIDRFIEQAPKRLVPFLLRHRYCVFAVAINTPGNMIIGGAGGIAMMSGFSRIYGFGRFILTVLIAVSPLPILTILSKLMIFS